MIYLTSVLVSIIEIFLVLSNNLIRQGLISCIIKNAGEKVL